jgi:hypothetical protein
MTKMRKLQQEYIYQAESMIMENCEIVQDADGTVLGLREDPSLEPVFPSTEELFDYVNATNPEKFTQIQLLQNECLQKADEKVATANQTLQMMEAKVQRLDHDLSAMETLLQATGDFHFAQAKTNEMAACQVTPGSEWILGKVIEHDPSTGMYTLSDEDVESNKSMYIFCLYFSIGGCHNVCGCNYFSLTDDLSICYL